MTIKKSNFHKKLTFLNITETISDNVQKKIGLVLDWYSDPEQNNMALVMRLSRKLCAIGRHQKHFGLSFRHLSTSSSANVKAVASSPSLSQLEKYIAERQPAQALSLFKRLSSPPSKMISQKLAILLSKKGTKTHANSAFEILRNIYT
jgi:hypothetical protein